MEDRIVERVIEATEKMLESKLQAIVGTTVGKSFVSTPTLVKDTKFKIPHPVSTETELAKLEDKFKSVVFTQQMVRQI
jgi:hypothetical protein